MSLFAALSTGIAGLYAQDNKINIISDNLANVNTPGFKQGVANFESFLNNTTASNYSPGGVEGTLLQSLDKQGDIQDTQSPTDLAISGPGLFAVSNTAAPGGETLYTRAGSFSPDGNGDFVNAAGFFLQGWRLDDNGNLPAGLAANSVDAGTASAAFQTVNVADISNTAKPTTAVTLQTNLQASEIAVPNTTALFQANLDATQAVAPTATVDIEGNLKSSQTAFSPLANYDPTMSAKNMASGAITPNFRKAITVFDNTGASHTVDMSFLNTGANSWAVEIYAQPATDVTQTDGQLAFGSVTFNADGTLATESPALSAPVTADWNNVGGPSNITFNLGTIGAADGLAQTDNSYAATTQSMPAYDPAVAGTSMATGAVTPDFTIPISVLDNTGAAQTLSASFLKTDTNTWAVEIYAVPAGAITSSGAVPGQVASGNVTFNSNGTLASVSSSLSTPIAILWAGASQPTETSFNLGTINQADGLSQNSAAYANTPTTPVLNYSPTVSGKNMASGAVAPQFFQPIDAVDNQGKLHQLTAGFLKLGNNTWAVELYSTPATDVTEPDGQVAFGTVTLNGDGSLASVSPSLTQPIAIDWNNVGGPTSVTFNLGTAGPPFGTPGAIIVGKYDGLQQLDSPFHTYSVVQNGNVAGNLASVAIDAQGNVSATYDNGVTRNLFRIPLAEFRDPDQLQAESGGVFTLTAQSGAPTYSQATLGGAGTIHSSALEASNVELASQLTDLIVAQRAYEANTKLITTSDTLLQDLDQMLG